MFSNTVSVGTVSSYTISMHLLVDHFLFWRQHYLVEERLEQLMLLILPCMSDTANLRVPLLIQHTHSETTPQRTFS